METQRPNYKTEAAWISEAERSGFVEANRLRFLREYQLKAVQAVQKAVQEGKDRFLFEMATGTGKTLTAAAVIKLFLRSQNASRVLFLVDRLELEDQAKKAFAALLANDLKTVIFKENRDDWHHAEIVVSTVQSLLFNNKYQKLFSPTDFDLVISDEAHRSIGGNARAVFDYFVGYKLGLTATPRDYLKRFDREASTGRDPREYERRLLLDTYRTFGCEQSEPTFRYTLLDGVKDGFLINPTVVDARTGITTQLLSEEGFTVDPVVAAKVNAGEWQQAEEYVRREVLDKPTEFFTLDKLRRAAAADRRLSLREILEKTFGLITRFKSKDELLDEEFAKFVADRKPPEDEAIPALRNYFKAYVSNEQIRQIIDSRHYTDLATSPAFSTLDFRAVPEAYRALIPEYVKDYVSLNQFAP